MDSNRAPRTSMCSPKKVALWALRHGVVKLVAAAIRAGTSSTEILRVTGIGIDYAAREVQPEIHYMAGERERRKAA